MQRVKAYYDTTRDRRVSPLSYYVERARLPRIGFVPVTASALVSADGWLWVRRPDLEPDLVGLVWSVALTPSSWDVFNPDGLYEHSVQLPPRFLLRAVTDKAAIGIMWDEMDVEYVVRYAVRRRATT